MDVFVTTCPGCPFKYWCHIPNGKQCRITINSGATTILAFSEPHKEVK